MIHVLFAVFNRRQITLDCLECFARQTERDYAVTVVDDGSTDGTAEAIGERFPGTALVKGDGSWWWTRSMNRGLDRILPLARPGDFVLTTNNDTLFAPDYLRALRAASEAHGRAVVGSVVRNSHDPSKIEDSGILVDWGHYRYQRVTPPPGAAVYPVDTLSCRGVLVPVEVFGRVGRFAEGALPHYAADLDFFFRARKAGFSLLMCRDAVVSHQEKPGEKARRCGTIGERWEVLTSIRSADNLRCHAYLILRHAPGLARKLRVLARYLAGAMLWLARGDRR